MSSAPSPAWRRRLQRLVLVALAAGGPFYWVASLSAPGQSLAVPREARPPDPAPPGMLGILTGPDLPEITGVMDGSPAARAGLLPGDQVVSINGVPIDDAVQLRQLIRVRRAGEKVVVRLTRDGELFEVGIVLQTLPPARGAVSTRRARGQATGQQPR
jgi:S1-C subfamily serine protease